MNEQFLINEAKKGRLYLGADLVDETKIEFVPLLRRAIDQAEKNDHDIEIFIDSLGGDGYACLDIFHLVEYAKRRGITVKTIVPAMAASSASVIAVAGTIGHRYIGPYAEQLVHYGQFGGVVVTTPEQLKRDSDRWDRWCRSSKHIYEEYCHIPDLDEKMNDDHFWIDAEHCIKWGLADEYLNEWM